MLSPVPPSLFMLACAPAKAGPVSIPSASCAERRRLTSFRRSQNTCRATAMDCWCIKTSGSLSLKSWLCLQGVQSNGSLHLHVFFAESGGVPHPSDEGYDSGSAWHSSWRTPEFSHHMFENNPHLNPLALFSHPCTVQDVNSAMYILYDVKLPAS